MEKKVHLSRLSGVEKAAILLLCLGEEATSKIFDALDDSEVRIISRCMMAFDHVPDDLAKQVVDHFRKTWESYTGIFVRGDEFVKKAISSGENTKRKEELLSQINAGAGFRPLETIAMMEARMVAGLLENEHPQTVALILSTQSPDHASRIVEYLREDLRANVMYRMARIDKVSPEVITQIEDSLRHEVGLVVSKDHQQVGGIEKVVEILGRMIKGRDRAILAQMEENDPAMADAIRRRMFTFEDLLFIDDRAMQAVLREVNNDVLILALRSASDEVKEKIFGNISKRASEMLREDLEAMGPVRIEDVERSQREIVNIALKLEEDGKIAIPGRGANDVLV